MQAPFLRECWLYNVLAERGEYRAALRMLDACYRARRRAIEERYRVHAEVTKRTYEAALRAVEMIAARLRGVIDENTLKSVVSRLRNEIESKLQKALDTIRKAKEEQLRSLEKWYEHEKARLEEELKRQEELRKRGVRVLGEEKKPKYLWPLYT